MVDEPINLRVALRDGRLAAMELQGVRVEVQELGNAAQTAGRKAAVSSGAWSKFGAAGALVGRGLMYGAAGATALGVAAGAWGIKTAASLQTATMNLTTLTGSAKTAKGMVKQLNDYGNSTTFDTEPLAAAAEQMLTFGIGAKDVLPDMKMLGDIAMGNQQKMNGLALVFAQVQGVGHLMGGDLNQMINNGFNPLLDMSKRTGKSMGDLRKAMAAGKISFQDVVKSMQDATAKGGTFYHGASNGSKTLAGAWGNLTGTISSGIGMALQPLLPMLDAGISRFADWASKKIPALQKAIRGWVSDLKNGTGTIGKLETGVKKAGAVVGGVVNFLKSHKGEVIAFTAVILGFAAAIGVVSAVMSINPVTLLIVGLALLGAWFVHLYKTSKTFRTGVQQIGAALKPIGAFIARNFVPGIKLLAKAFLFLAKWGVWSYKQLLESAFTAFDGILAAAQKGLGWIPGLGGKIKSARKSFDEFQSGVTGVLDGVTQGINDANAALDRLGQKHATPDVTVRYRTSGAGAGSTAANKFAGNFAGGGVVRHRSGGVLARIGEAGRDEAIVPLNDASYVIDRSGVTRLPASGGVPGFDASDLMPSTDDIQPVGGSGDLIVPVYIDRQQVAEAVVSGFDDMAARR